MEELSADDFVALLALVGFMVVVALCAALEWWMDRRERKKLGDDDDLALRNWRPRP